MPETKERVYNRRLRPTNCGQRLGGQPKRSAEEQREASDAKCQGNKESATKGCRGAARPKEIEEEGERRKKTKEEKTVARTCQAPSEKGPSYEAERAGIKGGR